MAAKQLEIGSMLEAYDADGDGTVTDAEIRQMERLIEIENEDAKQDAQRQMAWFALAGMLLYPFAVVLAVYADLTEGAKILGSMASVYFVSVAAIVAAFYGSQAYGTKAKSAPSAPTPLAKKPTLKK